LRVAIGHVPEQPKAVMHLQCCRQLSSSQ
jgi:hypothetical protein